MSTPGGGSPATEATAPPATDETAPASGDPGTPSASPSQPPPPPPSAEADPDAVPCDEKPLLAEAAKIQGCEKDADCDLAQMGHCSLGEQFCGLLPHRRGADLTGYRAALDRYRASCDVKVRCRCRQPTEAICRDGRCEAKR